MSGCDKVVQVSRQSSKATIANRYRDESASWDSLTETISAALKCKNVVYVELAIGSWCIAGYELLTTSWNGTSVSKLLLSWSI